MTEQVAPAAGMPMRWAEDRLSYWWASASDEARLRYFGDLLAFMDRARRMKRRAVLLLLGVLVTACASLDASLSLPAGVLDVLKHGALAAVLPFAYALALRSAFLGLVSHDLARAAFLHIARLKDPAQVSLEVHAPAMPPETLATGDLLAWAGANRRARVALALKKAEQVGDFVVMLFFVLGGPAIAIAAALRSGWPLHTLGIAVGVLVLAAALRPLHARACIDKHDRART